MPSRFFVTRPPSFVRTHEIWTEQEAMMFGFENVRPVMFKCFTVFAKHLRMLRLKFSCGRWLRRWIYQARSVWGVSILSKVLAGNVRLGVYGLSASKVKYSRHIGCSVPCQCVSFIGFLLPTHHLGNTPIAKHFPDASGKGVCPFFQVSQNFHMTFINLQECMDAFTWVASWWNLISILSPTMKTR